MTFLDRKTLILIPAYNEEGSIHKVIKNIKKECSNVDILVINDGSRDKTAVVRTQNVKRADLVAFSTKPDRPDRDVGIFRPAVLFVGDNRLFNGRSVFRERGQRAEIELRGFAGGGPSHNRIETAGEGGNSSGNNGCGAKTERGYGGAELATGLSHRFAWAYSCFFHGYCSDKLVKIRRLK